MKNLSSYIRVDKEKNYVHTSGITFQEFAKGIEIEYTNFLILAGFPSEGNYSRKLGLEYVNKEQAEAFYSENVYNYGDFCWIDFDNIEDLSKVDKTELAIMLYMSHMKEPFESFKIPSLDNKFAYLCHDDGWWNKVYMDDVTLYKKVLSYKIMKELKGRKREMAPIPDNILDKILKECIYGAVIDFDKKYYSGVRIIPVGEVKDMDNLHGILDRFRNKNIGFALEYNSNSKKWQIY